MKHMFLVFITTVSFHAQAFSSNRTKIEDSLVSAAILKAYYGQFSRPEPTQENDTKKDFLPILEKLITMVNTYYINNNDDPLLLKDDISSNIQSLEIIASTIYTVDTQEPIYQSSADDDIATKLKKLEIISDNIANPIFIELGKKAADSYKKLQDNPISRSLPIETDDTLSATEKYIFRTGKYICYIDNSMRLMKKTVTPEQIALQKRYSLTNLYIKKSGSQGSAAAAHHKDDDEAKADDDDDDNAKRNPVLKKSKNQRVSPACPKPKPAWRR